MLIGEAPGANEDQEVCWKSRNFADEMLAAIRLDEKVYISNKINYRPPDNRRY